MCVCVCVCVRVCACVCVYVYVGINDYVAYLDIDFSVSPSLPSTLLLTDSTFVVVAVVITVGYMLLL